jgi:hypothetical protein
LNLILLLILAIAAMGQVPAGGDSPQPAFPLVPSRYVIDAVTACGVVGDKTTDDTRSINYCIRSAPDNSTIWFRPTLKMKITSPIVWLNKHNLAIVGSPGAAWQGPSANDTNATFFWYGADGGTMLSLNGAGSFYIGNLTFLSAPNFATGNGGAATGISIDQAKGANTVTTNGIIEKVSVYGAEQNRDFRGILLSPTSNSNVEHMEVKDSSIGCSYTQGYANALGQGIVIGPTQNGQNQLFDGNTITGCAYGIYSAYGAIFYAQRNQFNQNGVHIYANNPYAALDIRNNDSENAYQFFVGKAGYGGCICFNRIAAVNPKNLFTPRAPIPPGSCALQFTGGGTVLVEGNSFDVSNKVTPVCGLGVPYGAPSIITKGNKWPNVSQTQLGLTSFGYNSLSEMEMPGLPLMFSSGNTDDCEPTLNFGCLNYVGAGNVADPNHWSASNSSGQSMHLLPDVSPKQPPCSYIGRIWFNTADASTTTMQVCMKVKGKLSWVTK